MDPYTAEFEICRQLGSALVWLFALPVPPDRQRFIACFYKQLLKYI